MGRFVIDQSFLLGPAVDEAAELHEAADGAFVWLTPRAARLPRPNYGGPDVWKTMVFHHAVPFKDGRRFATKVLSPFVDIGPKAPDRALIRAGYEEAMKNDRLDVTVKRQNTLAFIDRIYGLIEDTSGL